MHSAKADLDAGIVAMNKMHSDWQEAEEMGPQGEGLDTG